MHLKELHFSSFRSYESLRFEAGGGFNFLFGDNAQGKSNFLEGLYSLSLGRSYRTSKEEDVIRFGDPFARIEGIFTDSEFGGDFFLEVTWERIAGKEIRKTIRYNANVLTKLSELIDKAPIVLMTADDSDLIRGAPDRRRKFLDLLCSRLYPPYVAMLREYRHVLDARNHWLKLPDSRQDQYLGEVYFEKLCSLGSDIIYHRLTTLDSLMGHMGHLYQSIFGIIMPSLRYRSTIRDIRETTPEDIRESYRESMLRHSNLEREMGFTMVGPNRDDFDVKVEGRSMKNFSSLGEIRTVAVMLKLAEVEAISRRTGRNPVVCADDCFNEFDPGRMKLFLDYLASGRQVFYTSTGCSPEFTSLPDLSIYRVAEGSITHAACLA